MTHNKKQKRNKLGTHEETEGRITKKRIDGMNKQDLNQMHRGSFQMLDWKAYRPVEGIIRWSKSESWEHYIGKCIIVRLLKEGIPSNMLNEYFHNFPIFIGEDDDPCLTYQLGILSKKFVSLHNQKLKKWEIPKIYTEARFSKRLRGDIFVAASVEGRIVIEIADTETKKQLEWKERAYKNMGIGFLVVRI